MERGTVVLLVTLLFSATQLMHVFSLPTTAPAFLWSPRSYGLSQDGAKVVVHYQTISPKDLAKSVLEEGGWSNLVCSGMSHRENVDVALVFVGKKLQSSDISKPKQLDPALVDTLKMSFTSSNFSMAFPYVTISDEEGTLESLLMSGFSENCGNGLGINRVASMGACSIDGENLKKLHDLHSIHDFVASRMESRVGGQTDLIVFCNGVLQDLYNGKSEGEILSDLVSFLEQSGATYTILYASEPSPLLLNPTHLPLSRFLAEGTNTSASANSAGCDGVCQIKSSLLEGLFVAIVLLIILISGLCCMMGIDSPTRFETPQES